MHKALIILLVSCLFLSCQSEAGVIQKAIIAEHRSHREHNSKVLNIIRAEMDSLKRVVRQTNTRLSLHYSYQLDTLVVFYDSTYTEWYRPKRNH